MDEKFGIAGDIYRNQILKLKAANPNMKIDVDEQMFSVLRNSGSQVMRVGDVIHV